MEKSTLVNEAAALTVGNYEEQITLRDRRFSHEYPRIRKAYEEGLVLACSDCGSICIGEYTTCLECGGPMGPTQPLSIQSYFQAVEAMEDIQRRWPGVYLDPAIAGIFTEGLAIKDPVGWIMKIGESFRD